MFNMEKDTSRICAKIDLDAVRYNLDSMYHNLRPGTKIAAVIKTNAYGHGASEIAEAIEELPYLWGFAVATPEEAYELISDGRTKPILILGLAFPEAYDGLIERGVRITVSSLASAEQIAAAAVRLGRQAMLHIKLDTGMHRIGFAPTAQSVEEILTISQLPNIQIEGIFTHFARADETEKDPAYEQLHCFMNMINQIEQRGLSIPIRHCSNSAGIIELPEANLDMVRAGITLYGLWPSDEVDRQPVPIRPVMSLESHITFIKEVEPGQSISYGGTYTAQEKRRIATVPVGYGDGYARSLSNKGSVLIHGQRAPICGRVCMDQFMVDITDIPDVQIGDLVTLLGENGGDRITMEELGALSGRFNYEFACLITPRVPRVFIKQQGHE